MATTKVTPIRAMLGFKTASDADLLARATAVLNGMTSNAKFPSPPVDLATLKAAIDALVAAIAAALDGSKKAKAAASPRKNPPARAQVDVKAVMGSLCRWKTWPWAAGILTACRLFCVSLCFPDQVRHQGAARSD